MSKRAAFAACAAVLAAAALPGASPAAGGEWHHHPVVVLREAPHVHHVPIYEEGSWVQSGPSYYYSHHPRHIPAYPKPLTGYPVPIHDTDRPVVHLVPRYRVVVSAHVEWCAARYRSYDERTDTYQPYHGPRRYCQSPWR